MDNASAREQTAPGSASDAPKYWKDEQMKFSVFNGMPYGSVREHADRWPVPNELYEPEQALKAVAECLEEVELEDELGFDWIACAEHHYSPFSMVANVSVLASAMSQRVKRAKIAILGALIPLTGNPVRIAEEFAMIDNLTSGRLVAGLLRGAPYEYLVYNINPAESRSRFEEAWELIFKAWTDLSPFGWEGEHYHYRNVSIWPRPVQQPTPPIFISGSSRDSGEFAARKHVGLGLAFTNRLAASEASRFYREKAAANNWEPTSEQIIYQVNVHVAETDQQAFAAVRPAIERGLLSSGIVNANRLVANAGFFGERDAALTHRFQNLARETAATLESAIEMGTFLCGSPGTVTAQINRLRNDIGCGVLNLIFMGPRGPKLRSIELFANEVIPEVRDR
jgi:alkanesulfonate monooxygenase SsuD/methylene tetrahydromethanopterin reductase-like flavin-dependent oxidoreductase (luciferase family)